MKIKNIAIEQENLIAEQQKLTRGILEEMSVQNLKMLERLERHNKEILQIFKDYVNKIEKYERDYKKGYNQN